MGSAQHSHTSEAFEKSPSNSLLCVERLGTNNDEMFGKPKQFTVAIIVFCMKHERQAALQTANGQRC